MKPILLRALVACLTALGLAACDDAGDDVGPTNLDSQFRVRIVHASPDAPSVDVSAGGNVTIASNLAFREATAQLVFLAGEALNVRVDGLMPGGTATVIGPVLLSFDEDTDNTIIAVGNVANIEPLIISNPTSSVDAATVRAQVVHGSPSAPQVDVYVTAPDADLTQQVPLGSFSFKENLGPVEVPAGDYQIRVTLPNDPSTVVFDSGAVALPGSSDLLVVAVDNTGPGVSPISLVVADGLGNFEILDRATPAEFRVIHASPDAPAVDVVINDDFQNPVLESVPYTAFSDYLSVPAGTYNVKVTAENNPGAIVIDADLTLDPGRQYSIYAIDVLANIAPYVLVDDSRPVATEAKFRIAHLAPGAGQVDIYITAPGADIVGISPTLAGVDFTDETSYVGLSAGAYDVAVTVAGTKTIAIGPAAIDVSAGGVYTAVARDAPGAGAPFGLILLDDFD